MKRLMLLFCAAAITLFAVSCAPSAVVVTERPAPPVYVRPAPPRPGYIWVEGEWRARSGRYVWQNGYWTRPHGSRQWHGGHWEKARGGWYWQNGYWR
ncbi:YXWGXW repeat-containing protein [Deminuibacter soli]|uniref:YXWGXW repeat-containing protein n=1 Tax=Deminuibacter soli TaxID=2291815 RepID=A0A3E1NPI4_9BACT|nr:YXWGXW repeat-containing protein [Deminuibacter soli]RFM29698.1 hypothetical protein DXN05_01590 [Deminuibacter soli]